MTADGLEVRGYLIPDGELGWTFGPTGGPGGQHANRAHTRAELRFDIESSVAFPPEVKALLAERLGGPHVLVTVDESRSQWRNRQLARKRLAARLEDAMIEPRRRKATKPTRASKRRRLADKRARSETKALRRKPQGRWRG